MECGGGGAGEVCMHQGSQLPCDRLTTDTTFNVREQKGQVGWLHNARNRRESLDDEKEATCELLRSFIYCLPPSR